MAPDKPAGPPVQETGEQTNSQVQEESETQSLKRQEYVIGLTHGLPPFLRKSTVTTGNSVIHPLRQKVVICNTTFDSLKQRYLEAKPVFVTRPSPIIHIQNTVLKPLHTSGYGSGIIHSCKDEHTSSDSIVSVNTQIQPPPDGNTVVAPNQPPYNLGPNDFVHGATPTASSHGSKSEPLFPTLGRPQEIVLGSEQPPQEGRRQSNPLDTGKPPPTSKLGYEEAVEEQSAIDTSSSVPQIPKLPSPVLAYHGLHGYPVKSFESHAGDDTQQDFDFTNDDEELMPENLPLTRSFTSLKYPMPPHTPLFEGQGAFFTFNEEDISLDSGYMTSSTSFTVKGPS